MCLVLDYLSIYSLKLYVIKLVIHCFVIMHVQVSVDFLCATKHEILHVVNSSTVPQMLPSRVS